MTHRWWSIRVIAMLGLSLLLAAVLAWACAVMNLGATNPAICDYYVRAGQTYTYGVESRFGYAASYCAWVDPVPAERARVRNGWPPFAELPGHIATPAEGESRARLSCGWPFTTFHGEVTLDNTTGLPLGKVGVLYLRGGAGKPLPCRPTLGLLGNTVLFAAALTACVIASELLKRHLRRRRGHCPSCSYNRRGVLAACPCPECGAPQ